MTTDLAIGALAIGLGITALLAGLFSWDWAFKLRKAQFVQRKWGPNATRLLYAVIGILLVIVGLAICFGIRPRYTLRTARNSMTTFTIVACSISSRPTGDVYRPSIRSRPFFSEKGPANVNSRWMIG